MGQACASPEAARLFAGAQSPPKDANGGHARGVATIARSSARFCGLAHARDAPESSGSFPCLARAREALLENTEKGAPVSLVLSFCDPWLAWQRLGDTGARAPPWVVEKLEKPKGHSCARETPKIACQRSAFVRDSLVVVVLLIEAPRAVSILLVRLEPRLLIEAPRAGVPVCLPVRAGVLPAHGGSLAGLFPGG